MQPKLEVGVPENPNDPKALALCCRRVRCLPAAQSGPRRLRAERAAFDRVRPAPASDGAAVNMRGERPPVHLGATDSRSGHERGLNRDGTNTRSIPKPRRARRRIMEMIDRAHRRWEPAAPLPTIRPITARNFTKQYETVTCCSRSNKTVCQIVVPDESDFQRCPTLAGPKRSPSATGPPTSVMSVRCSRRGFTADLTFRP